MSGAGIHKSIYASSASTINATKVVTRWIHTLQQENGGFLGSFKHRVHTSTIDHECFLCSWTKHFVGVNDHALIKMNIFFSSTVGSNNSFKYRKND